MKINADAIRELAELLKETGLTEIEIVDGDRVIRVNKGMIVSGNGNGNGHHALNMPSDPTQPQQANTSAPDTVAHSHPGAVKSPMVGTAYASPEPSAAPFVKKGDTVQAGDTLLIIEAMKVMNPIKAEKPGTVTQVLIRDGQPVEYGDVLMVIE